MDQPSAVAQLPEPGLIAVKSTPDGADITVDGKFVGNTPATLKLPPGDHTVVVEKSGFKKWDRSLTVMAGASMTIDAQLEKVP